MHACMLSYKMSLCLNLAKMRGIFALARIGSRRQQLRWEDLYGRASNQARQWNKHGVKAEGLRRLHTSASLFTNANVLLKLHYSQCILSLDTTVLHKLLTNITIVCIFSSIVPRPPPIKCLVSLSLWNYSQRDYLPSFHGEKIQFPASLALHFIFHRRWVNMGTRLIPSCMGLSLWLSGSKA